MNKMTVYISSIFMIIALGLQSYIFADTLQLNGINTNLMEPVSIKFNGTSENVYTGALKGSLNGKISYFFCYDLNHTITVPSPSNSPYTATLLNPSSSSFPSNLHLPSSFNIQVATSMLNTTNLAAFTSVDQYAGLQLAIWTVLYDWSQGVTPNLNTSNCTTGFCAPGASSALIADANAYLATARPFAAAFPNGQSLGNWVLVSSMSGSNINQVLIGLGAPEPQTYLLLGSLLAIVCCAAKYKRC